MKISKTVVHTIGCDNFMKENKETLGRIDKFNGNQGRCTSWKFTQEITSNIVYSAPHLIRPQNTRKNLA